MSWRRPRAGARLARTRRPATGRLNSGVRRQKNIRFQPRFAPSFAPLIFTLLPSLAAALVPFGSHAMLRTARMARSHFACVALAGFGINEPHRLVSQRRTRSFGDGRRKVRGARSGLLASAFGKSAWASTPSASHPPNNSFKPTPCRGVGRVLCATLARVRRPATGRLNSGVRRQKSFLQICRSQA